MVLQVGLRMGVKGKFVSNKSDIVGSYASDLKQPGSKSRSSFSGFRVQGEFSGSRPRDLLLRCTEAIGFGTTRCAAYSAFRKEAIDTQNLMHT